MKRSNKQSEFNENDLVSHQLEFVEEVLEGMSNFINDDNDTLNKINNNDGIDQEFVQNRMDKTNKIIVIYRILEIF